MHDSIKQCRLILEPKHSTCKHKYTFFHEWKNMSNYFWHIFWYQHILLFCKTMVIELLYFLLHYHLFLPSQYGYIRKRRCKPVHLPQSCKARVFTDTKIRVKNNQERKIIPVLKGRNKAQFNKTVQTYLKSKPQYFYTQIYIQYLILGKKKYRYESIGVLPARCKGSIYSLYCMLIIYI